MSQWRTRPPFKSPSSPRPPLLFSPSLLHLLKHLFKMLDPPETVDRYDCTRCSHQSASLLQLDHHVQRNHKNVYAAELFHAIVEPQQFLCICCDYKSYYHFEMYEHSKQVHSPWTGGKEYFMSFCEEFVGYPCDCCRYKADSSICLAKHHDLCEKMSPSRRPQDSSAEDVRGAESLDLNWPNARTSRAVETMESNVSPRESFGGEAHLLKCNHCSYRTKYKPCLKRHILSHASEEEINTWFHCYHCSYRTRFKSALKTHMLRHAENQQINWVHCNHCSHRTKHKRYLKAHMLNKHAIHEEIDWFHCDHCSYKSKRKSALKTHMLRHATIEEIVRVKTKEINWIQCNHCSYRAKQKGDLKRHMLQHAKEKEIEWFQCDLCLYRCKQKAYLKTHSLRHANDEEINWFQCNLCSYRSKLKSSLKTHMLRHTKSKEIIWFQCDQCSHRTKSKGNLSRHMLQHAKNEDINWFYCDHCFYRSKQKASLKSHMLRHAKN